MLNMVSLTEETAMDSLRKMCFENKWNKIGWLSSNTLTVNFIIKQKAYTSTVQKTFGILYIQITWYLKFKIELWENFVQMQ